MMLYLKMRFAVFKRKRWVYYFNMKEINGNTLIVVRRKSVKRLRSGKVKELS